ncbi:MAG: hypothetical protein P8K80_02815 [Phycisphaerales bacterium]|nr:hypothetical protein [Phycisphaerales bacterium]
MTKLLLSVGAALFLLVMPVSAEWIQWAEPHRASTLSLWDRVHEIDTSSDGYWYADVAVGNGTDMARAVQESNFGGSWVDFMATTVAESGAGSGNVGSHSSLRAQMSLEQATWLDISWAFEVEREGAAEGETSLRIEELESGSPLLEMSVSVTGSGAASIQLNPGIYLVSMLVNSEVESGGAASSTAFIFMDFVVPAPGGLLLGFMVLLRTRRRRCH